MAIERTDGSGGQLVQVFDEPQECPYLDDMQARMPLLWATGSVSPEELDSQLAKGRRRSGVFFYYTACPNCIACEPTRLIARDFKWSRSMRRVLQKGDQVFTSSWEDIKYSEEYYDLFNLHRSVRQLGKSEHEMTRDDFICFLIESCCPTKNLVVRKQGEVVAVSVTDVGQDSLSAVYCYFDPVWSNYSVGTYAILKQIQFAIETSRTYLYLGMYVAKNQHLNYKARFIPQQRFLQGDWREIVQQREN